MTVAQLIEMLHGLPADLPVIVEGCDCVGDASGAVIHDDRALITRPDGIYSAVRQR